MANPIVYDDAQHNMTAVQKIIVDENRITSAPSIATVAASTTQTAAIVTTSTTGLIARREERGRGNNFTIWKARGNATVCEQCAAHISQPLLSTDWGDTALLNPTNKHQSKRMVRPGACDGEVPSLDSLFSNYVPSRCCEQMEQLFTGRLVDELQCSALNHQGQFEINFFSCGDGQYHESMLPLYAFFALASNVDAVVEICVPSRIDFIKRNAAALRWLLSEFGRCLCVRSYSVKKPNKMVANTVRFVEVPYVKANFTYIGDTDILIYESILHEPRGMRFRQMKQTGLSYSNIIRPNTTRLTGVILVHTQSFFTPGYIAQQKLTLVKARSKRISDPTENDEMILYRQVKDAGLGLPPLEDQMRPLHGLHVSRNRGRGKRMPHAKDPQTYCKALSLRFLSRFLCYSQVVCELLKSVAADILAP